MSEYGVETGPMVYIANLWDSAADNSEVRVFSNCDEVALYYNDELVAVQGHDETMWGPTEIRANPVLREAEPGKRSVRKIWSTRRSHLI